MNKAFVDINEWFKITLLSLNFNKSHYLQFRTKSSQKMNINICYNNKHITKTLSAKLLGLIIELTLSWKNFIDQLMLSRLSSTHKRQTSMIYAIFTYIKDSR
jgi:hypothetical protein